MSGGNRRGSIGGQRELVFFRVDAVSYGDLHSVLGNEQASHQLESLMTSRFCLENLRFLQALDALHADQTPDGQRGRLEQMFAQWVGDSAPGQVNLSVNTTAGLLEAWAALAPDADPAQDKTLHALLNSARTQVTRLIVLGPLAELSSRLLDSPRRQSTSPLEAMEPHESGRLLSTISAYGLGAQS